jgi:hypothetical protein
MSLIPETLRAWFVNATTPATSQNSTTPSDNKLNKPLNRSDDAMPDDERYAEYQPEDDLSDVEGAFIGFETEEDFLQAKVGLLEAQLREVRQELDDTVARAIGRNSEYETQIARYGELLPLAVDKIQFHQGVAAFYSQVLVAIAYYPGKDPKAIVNMARAALENAWPSEEPNEA